MPDSPANSTTERPIREVSRWKAFGIFSLAGLLVLLGVVFIPWDIKPVDDSDLVVQHPRLAPEENAFTWFESAGKMPIKKVVPRCMAIGSPNEQWDPVSVDEILTENAPVLAKVEKGLDCQRYASPVLESDRSPVPWLQKYKVLASLLCQKSKHRQLVGDYAGAAASGIHVLRFGRLIVDNPDMLIEWRVGIDYEWMALERLEELVADAKTPDPVLVDIKATLDRWDPQELVKGFRQAMQCEYEILRTDMTELSNCDSKNSESSWVYSRFPYVWKSNMIKRLMVSCFRNRIANADRPYARLTLDYSSKLQEPSGWFGNVAFYASPNCAGKLWFIRETFGSHDFFVDRLLARKYQQQAHVAALRLKIALRLYEQKYGQLPDDLNALVPEFIREIPKDPYDDKPFRYSKIEKKVWAVGIDLVDDGGKAVPDTALPDNGFIFGKDWRDCIMGKSFSGYDLVMPLGIREMKPNLVPQGNSSDTLGAK